MNIKQNIVRIKTATQMGSGIIYPCEINENEFGKSKFIIFTNKHLVEDLTNENDLILSVDFDIYDRNGILLEIPKEPEGNRVNLQLFYEPFDEKDNNEKEDIAAFLLTFDYKIDIDLSNKILWDDTYLNDLFIEGCPQILLDNTISSKIQLKGQFKTIFPSNDKIGVFQITDDYHWYGNFKDLRLFQGFSGSPIYNTDDNFNFIVGMNQSMLNIEDGENPFKLLYFYKFKFILEYLREQGCIIFERNKDQSASIRWIYKQDNDEFKKNINLLLLGASGAGKSSFAKTFLLHSDLIDSTNDGQTTRSNIIYEISLLNKEPKAKIKFLDKEQFVTRMEQLNYSNYLFKIMGLIYNNIPAHTLEEYLQYLYMNDEISSKIKDNIKKILLPTNNLDYNRQHEYNVNLNNVIEDVIEDFFKKYMDNNKVDKESFIIKNEEIFQKTLSQVEGFYYESEFEFFKKSFADGVDKKEQEINKTDFSKYFTTYYEYSYSKIINILIQQKIVTSNNYSTEILFNKTEKLLEILPLCLQVKDNRSLTGMVDYVYICDSVSNDYAFIMDDLRISTLKLIDTYGLDHANWDQEKGRVLSNIVYNLQEKKLIQFNSDLAVTYIKKLDSGKPTELKSIIPQIYNIIPQAPIYCVFNGLDIFLDSKIDLFQSFDYFNSSETIPKSIRYLISEKGKHDILNSFHGQNDFKENLYHTLKNNIISFCSNTKKINSHYNIYDNNRKEVYKLLLSICMKEYSSMNIIPPSVIEGIEERGFDDQIDKIIKQIFKESSKTDWSSTHWKTRGANYDRIDQKKTIGYWGTYEHRWNQLFHQGYIKVISKGERNLLEIGNEVNYITAIDSCIKNMEESFLGPSYQLAYFDIKNVGYKHEFRKLIEEMYKVGVEMSIYKINPFSNTNSEKMSETDFLNDVCDFLKGYEYIKDALRKHFKNCLIKTIKHENTDKSKNLLKINYNFYMQLKKLQFDFNKKYENVSFDDLIKYYSEK